MKQRWIKYLLYSITVLVVSGFALFLIQLGYSYSWTGFGEFTLTNPDAVRSKTLWDWMELLIVPLVLAGGAFFLNRSERNTEREISTDRQQEAALQIYFDRMSELLLKEKLRTTKKEEIRDIARTRTVSILRILNTRRNNLVIQFLREAKLITNEKSILYQADMQGMDLREINIGGVYLNGANLESANLERARLTNANLVGAILAFVNFEQAHLDGANLEQAVIANATLKNTLMFEVNLGRASLFGSDLRGAHLYDADLSNANLDHANLEKASIAHARLKGASLSEANLSGASLFGSDLSNADLSNADLKGTDLKDANLSGANLKGAKNVTEKQLATTKSLTRAILPDGTKHRI